jgi:hypothetical protein
MRYILSVYSSSDSAGLFMSAVEGLRMAGGAAEAVNGHSNPLY